jgi:hypothetical protein
MNQVRVTKEQHAFLKTKKLFIGTPMYGGANFYPFCRSMLNLVHILDLLGIRYEFMFLSNESLVQRARNIIANRFLKSDCTHLMFVDADISFEPADLISMILANKPIIGGAYPLKKIEPSEDPRRRLVFRLLNETKEVKVNEVIQCKYLGTGFMLIKRKALEELKPFVPNYKMNSGGDDDGQRYWAFFHCDVVNDEYLSEDYWFCHKLMENGFEIWLAPWVKLTHMGQYEYVDSIMACLERSKGKVNVT